MMHLEDRAAQIRPAAASNLLLWCIAGFFALAIAWACFTQLDRTVHGQGRVIPAARLQTVSNLEGGIVSAILVKPGMDVATGTPLVQLDRTASAAELGSGAATVGALQARTTRLAAEVAGAAPHFAKDTPEAAAGREQAAYAARQAELAGTMATARARIAQAQRAIAEADAAHAAKLAQRDTAREQSEALRPLVEKGIEPRLSLVQARNAALAAQSEADAAAAATQRARAALAEAQASMSQQREEWRAHAATDLAAAQGELSSRQSALPALADKDQRTVVRAPMAGRINRLLFTTIGGSVRAGEPLLELVPSESALTVEAWVKPEDIAFVHKGQRALVKITAYDYSVYGGLEGKVSDISPDATVEERTGEAHYTVRVSIEAGALRGANGAPLPIGAGMVA
ncbi:MAG TPA: HlyD family type I secretion periplasmic adaptor subunit, partial [Novosphingobium sp.]|nr:HlyD family type I secretion periplasmic adaptor subunit [Novosphingobium sp.]